VASTRPVLLHRPVTSTMAQTRGECVEWAGQRQIESPSCIGDGQGAWESKVRDGQISAQRTDSDIARRGANRHQT
jgi:hypothetical protein